MKFKFPVYDNYFGTDDKGEPSERYRSLDDVFEYVTSGAHGLAERTLKARELASNEPDAYKKFKSRMVTFIPAGRFDSIPAKSETLVEHSGVMVVDFDKVHKPAELRDLLSEHAAVHLAFISPSGTGVKGIVAVNPVPCDAKEHSAAFRTVADVLTQHTGCEVDMAGSDARRGCTLAHDADAVYHEATNPIPWSMPEPKPKPAMPSHPLLDNGKPSDLETANMLSCIPADDYDVWLKVGMGLHEEGYPQSVWDSWSSAAGNYDADACDTTWASFGKTSGERVGYGTLVELAKSHGWRPPLKTARTPKPARTAEPPPPPPAMDILHDTDNDADVPLQLPDSVYQGVFDLYRKAYQGKSEIPAEYNFACLYTAIGAVCGRRYYIDAVEPIYPNAFTALVGTSARARKSTALKAITRLLSQADRDVYNLTSLSTPEGLVNLFVPDRFVVVGQDDAGDDITERVPGGLSSLVDDFGDTLMPEMMEQRTEDEGFRVLLTLDEIAKTLRKAGQHSSSGLMEMLAEMFGYPANSQVPTRTNPISAPFPCLSILGATTYEWFESAFKEEDIHGGIANRFLYFYDPPRTERHFISKPPNRNLISEVARQVSGLRTKFGTFDKQVPFTFTEEAEDAGQAWYEDLCDDIEAEENVFVKHAIARTDLYLKKSALIHAILFNDSTTITIDNLRWAADLNEYLIRTTRAIYGEFNTSQQKRVEERIVSLLTKKPWMSASAIYNQMRWASRKDVNDTLQNLVRGQMLVEQQTSQTLKYAVVNGD